MIPHTLFISDLHLEEANPAITERFLRFLEERAASADALYILGDFFEAWIGDDDESDFHNLIIQALKRLTDEGLPIFLMHGNRDFLIGKRFLAATGLTLLRDPTLIDLYGKDALLMHGDSLCTLDASHQRYRKCVNHPLVKWLFLRMPLRFRRYIAKKLRHKSQAHNAKKSNFIMDVAQDEVERVMNEANTTLLIHGHTHRPAIHSFTLKEQTAHRIVLSDWDQDISILNYNHTGRYELERLN